MHVEPLALLRGQRQAVEKFALRAVESRAGPFDRRPGDLVHIHARGGDRRVVIAEDGGRAARHVVHHGIDRPGGIRAVADVVAEKNIALRARVRGMREAGGKSLAVRVDVAHQGDQHFDCFTGVWVADVPRGARCG